MDKWRSDFLASIKAVEFNDEGELVAVKGSFISRSTEDMQ